VVIDPCAGSGTTLLAAMQTLRRAYGFEIKKGLLQGCNRKGAESISAKTILKNEDARIDFTINKKN
jgi:site-specific DNA-methyltransferase (adenine-specific)